MVIFSCKIQKNVLSGVYPLALRKAKGGEDKSAPSFKRYVAQHQPEHALRFSKRGYRQDGGITNLPLYLARKTREML